MKLTGFLMTASSQEMASVSPLKVEIKMQKIKHASLK